MAEELLKTTTVTADDPPNAIDLPELSASAGVIYLFEGDHTEDLELVSDDTDSDGLDIPAGKRWISGPHRAQASRRMRWLYAASSTSVTVQIIRDDQSSFRHEPADSEVTPGTGASNLGKAEDSPHASGDVGVLDLGVRNDNASTSLSDTDGDYTPIGVDEFGRPIVRIDDISAITGQAAAADSLPVILAANDGTVIGDVDLAQLEIPGDGAGTNEVERRAAALKASIEADQVGLATDALDDALRSVGTDQLLTRSDEDAGSASKSAALSDGGTLTVTLNAEDREQVTYTAKSDEDYSVTVEHHAQTGQSGDSVVQDTSGGVVTGGNVDGNTVDASGKSVTVTLTDESSDGNNSATATLLAKVI